jgi:hypothetical protein
MKLKAALPIVLLAAGLSTVSLAKEPSAVHQCVVNKCVKKYFMCKPGSSKTCKPRLTTQQRETLEAYRLCKKVSKDKRACKHPDINSNLYKKLGAIDKGFNACKLSCYKKNDPKLYKSVFSNKNK